MMDQRIDIHKLNEASRLLIARACFEQIVVDDSNFSKLKNSFNLSHFAFIDLQFIS